MEATEVDIRWLSERGKGGGKREVEAWKIDIADTVHKGKEVEVESRWRRVQEVDKYH